MFVCLRSSVRIDTSDFHQIFVHVTHGCGSVLIWQRGDMLRISGFVNDVIFAHKLIGCSTWPRGRGSEAHTCAASVLVHRNTRCRQRTLGTISCSQGLLGRSGRVEYLWYHVCMFAHNIPAYIATRKWRMLKVTLQVATPGTESAVYDCLVTAANCTMFYRPWYCDCKLNA